MDNFSINIENEVFEKINDGLAEYVILLNNTKNKQLKEGNFITLVNEVGGKTFNVKITALYFFDSIKDLFAMVGKTQCGYSASTNVDLIEDKYTKMFNDEKIVKYGVIAAKIEKI